MHQLPVLLNFLLVNNHAINTFTTVLFKTFFVQILSKPCSFFAMTCILVIALVIAAEENRIIYVTFWFLVAYFTWIFVVTTIK